MSTLNNHYKVIIIGGGIVGAGIFRDLALHGIDTLLVDKKDFSSQTSERSSKMLHGGIRYLENFDFALIFEALHEKNSWIKLAPQLAVEKNFILPVFENSKRPLWQIAIGLFLYDLLSGFKNKPFRILNTNETLNAEPTLNPQGLKGAGVYADAVMEDALMTLACIYDGQQNKKCLALNHTSFVSQKKLEKTNLVTLKNEITGVEYDVHADHIIFALGPFTDMVLKHIPEFNWQNVLLPSKGSHLWIKKDRLPITSPLVMTSHDKEDRVIFVIPHHDKVLVGTTEIKTKENFYQVQISKDEILYLLRHLNDYFPTLNLNESDIISHFSGIRPLVKEDGDNLGKTSREHKVYRPRSDVFVIAGGKYTTFRTMGQEITRTICDNYFRPYNHELTLTPFQNMPEFLPMKKTNHDQVNLEKILSFEMPKNFEDLVKRRLALPSRALWRGTIGFDEYFLKHKNLINRYFPLSDDEIKNYP